MNNVYFACRTCRTLTDAGYRWACWQLEHPGIVSRNFPVSVQDVLAAAKYWGGPEVEESVWLRENILPTVSTFLEIHREHDIVYGDYDEITGDEIYAFLYWLEVGAGACPTPRWFAEVLHLQTWTEVVNWVREHKAPWWWRDEELKDVARVRFNELKKRESRITIG